MSPPPPHLSFIIRITIPQPSAPSHRWHDIRGSHDMLNFLTGNRHGTNHEQQLKLYATFESRDGRPSPLIQVEHRLLSREIADVALRAAELTGLMEELDESFRNTGARRGTSGSGGRRR